MPLQRLRDWPAELDSRAFADMAQDREKPPKLKPKCQRTKIPTGARAVVRIEGVPTRQHVKTLRVGRQDAARERETTMAALECDPMTENRAMEIQHSESEGRYERQLVRQAEAARDRKKFGAI